MLFHPFVAVVIVRAIGAAIVIVFHEEVSQPLQLPDVAVEIAHVVATQRQSFHRPGRFRQSIEYVTPLSA